MKENEGFADYLHEVMAEAEKKIFEAVKVFGVNPTKAEAPKPYKRIRIMNGYIMCPDSRTIIPHSACIECPFNLGVDSINDLYYQKCTFKRKGEV